MFCSYSEAVSQEPVLSEFELDQVVTGLGYAYNEISQALVVHYTTPVLGNNQWTLEVGTNPAGDDTFTVDDTTYTFVDEVETGNDILIGDTIADTVKAIAYSINGWNTTTVNTKVSATYSGSTVTLKSRCLGNSNTDYTVETSVPTKITITQSATATAWTYPVLTELNIRLCAMRMIEGQPRSGIGSGSADYGTRLDTRVKNNLKDIAKGTLMIVSDSGTLLEYCDEALPTSNTEGMHPFADESDPTNWKHDTDKDWDRG